MKVTTPRTAIFLGFCYGKGAGEGRRGGERVSGGFFGGWRAKEEGEGWICLCG